MKKKIISTLLAVTLTAAALAGCGNSSGGQRVNPQQQKRPRQQRRRLRRKLRRQKKRQRQAGILRISSGALSQVLSSMYFTRMWRQESKQAVRNLDWMRASTMLQTVIWKLKKQQTQSKTLRQTDVTVSLWLVTTRQAVYPESMRQRQQE